MSEILSRDTFKAGLVAEGAVTVPTPATGTDAASKQYVDDRVPKVTVASTAPGAPALNDVWIDTT